MTSARSGAGAICQDPRSIPVFSGETVTVDIACVGDSTGSWGEGYWD